MSLTDLERRYIRDRRAGKCLNPTPGFRITTPYKKRGSAWSLGYHTGEDHACPRGTPFVAVSWGHVIGAGWGGYPHALGRDYGNVVMVEMASGEYEWFGAHLLDIHVRVGQAVIPGMLLGHVDDTGNSFGNHLHFEARPVNGRFGSDVDPALVKCGKP